MARIGLDVTTVLPPYGLALALSAAGAGGVWGATGLEYYVVTAYNGTGETTPCVEVGVNVDVVTKKVTVTWTPVAGATGYKVYRTTTPGTYGASSLRDTVPGESSDEYVDDGDALSAGTPPSANTTAGAAPNYGTPPTLDVTPLAIGDLQIGQCVAYWVNWVISGGTAESGNPRQFTIDFVES
jgi:hypothetical protein